MEAAEPEPAQSSSKYRQSAARREAARPTLVALGDRARARGAADAADLRLAADERDIDAAHADALGAMARKQALALELAAAPPPPPVPAVAPAAGTGGAGDDDDDDSWSAFF